LQHRSLRAQILLALLAIVATIAISFAIGYLAGQAVV
jgi:hypothetical protein